MQIAKKVHFMGIGGSGMSAVAQIAQSYGYSVSGCDLNLDSPYVKQLTFPIYSGHSAGHLKDIDILAVTPAVFYLSDSHPEIQTARDLNILLTWQDFMGQYLHRNKIVICVAGAHGKSTTTAWIGHLLENAGLDPTVEIGATDNLWHNNVRLGKGQYFISEADEFHDNFASYHPDVIILNNVEMDHPEYFHTIDKLLDIYQKFINNLKPNGVVIYNTDSALIHKLLLPPNSIPYSFNEFKYTISLPGNHNKSNALGVLKLGEYLNIPQSIILKTLVNFTGVGRRMELLGEKNGIKVYDDYANHPTAFAAVLQALHETHPNSSLTAIIEPHTFSRLRTMISDLPSSLKLASHIIITKIYASRETDPGDFSGANIASAVGGIYIPEFQDIVSHIKSTSKPDDIIVVLGSGNSYKLSRQILESL